MKPLYIHRSTALLLHTILQGLTWILRVFLFIAVGYGVVGIGASIYASEWHALLRYGLILAVGPIVCLVTSVATDVLAKYVRSEADMSDGLVELDPKFLLSAIFGKERRSRAGKGRAER